MKNLSFLILAVLCLLFQEETDGQIRRVTGKLTDPTTGEPLPGVNVLLEGTTTGTVTNFDGYYEIDAPVGSVLLVSFVGYSTQRIVVGPEPESERVKSLTKVYRHSIPDNPNKSLSPYFFVQSDNPSLDRMPLKATNVDVSIAGVIADVKVKQLYVNEGRNTLEAIYIFPGSTRAAVYGMQMQIGDRILKAKIREKVQARKEYETAKAEGKTATLLEQKRPNVFQMNVANILPGDSIWVELQYTELMEPTEGIYQFVYPTVVGPRYSTTEDTPENKDEKWLENPYLTEGKLPNYTFSIKTHLNAGVPIQRLSSTSHKIMATYTNARTAEIELDPFETFGGNRDYILNYSLRGKQIETGLLTYHHNDENFFLLMVQPPEKPTESEIPPREYIFIIDVSGSMNGFPLNVSKNLFESLISRLRTYDKFNILLFAGGNQVFSEESANATPENIKDAIRFVNNQNGGGGTELLPALKRALNMPVDEEYARTFVILTDGYVSVEKEAFQLVRNNRAKANLFACGIGSSVNRYLIEGLANAGMGEPFIATSELEAKKVGKKMIDIIEKPVFTHINIDYHHFKAYDIEPTVAADIFAERPLILFGKFEGNPSGNITISGYSGNKLKSINLSADSSTKESNQALRYLWARNRIKYLDDFAQYYETSGNYYSETKIQPSEAHEKLITELGLKYNLLTNYTSFIAVDSLVRNKTKQYETVKQPLPLPQGVSNLAVGDAISLSLMPDIKSLEEVVVVGYGTVRKADLTSAVSSVNTSEFSNNGNTSVQQVLQGRISGVEVITNQGAPGSSANILIRGNSTIGSSNPLYILDGVPVNSETITQLSPTEVESVEVLKDASSTAIYGARGANGVVVINSKKGKEQSKFQIQLNSTVGFDRVNKLPNRQNLYAQGLTENGDTKWAGADQNNLFSWGPAISGLTYDGSNYLFDKNGHLIANNATNGMNAKVFDPYQVFKTGVKTTNEFSISLSHRQQTLRISYTNTQKSGILPESNTTLNAIKLRSNHVLKFAKIGTTFAYQNNDSKNTGNRSLNPGMMYSILNNPTTFDLLNGFNPKEANQQVQSYMLPNNLQRSAAPALVNNPYWMLHRNLYRENNRQLVGGLDLDFQLIHNLHLKTISSFEQSENEMQYGISRNSASVTAGSLFYRNMNTQSFNQRVELNFSKSGNLELNSSLGYHFNWNNSSIERNNGYELATETGYALSDAKLLDTYSFNLYRRTHAGYGTLNAMYNNLVGINASYRQENSSTWKNSAVPLKTWYLGGLFKFSNLLNSSSWLNNGKLFANVSYCDREFTAPLADNAWNTSQFDLNNVTNFYSMREVKGFENLSPEKVSKFETGLTLDFWNNRISTNVSFYNSMSKQLIVPSIQNTDVQLINKGNLRTKGLDADLTFIALQNALNWKIKATFTRYRNKVTGLAATDTIRIAGFQEVSSCLLNNRPYGVLVGSKFQRNEHNQKIIGNDGFPLVDSKPGIIGNTNPDWIAGIENSFRWKGIELSFLFDFKKGGDVWNGTRATMNYYGTSEETGNARNISGYVFDGVTSLGEPNMLPVDFSNSSTNTALNRWVRYGKTGVAEESVEDGSWIRLRELSISYSLPRNFVQKLKMKSLTITTSGRNLWMHTPYTGIDPETTLTGMNNGIGLDYFNMPNVRSYAIGIKVGF